MARSVDEINAQILTNLVSNFAAIGITIDTSAWSNRNRIRNIVYAIATGIAFFEQLLDVFKASVEAIVAQGYVGSAAWVQDKMFAFQYSDNNPQIVQIVNGVPQYPVADPSLQIIAACSNTSNSSNGVLIKVATGSPLIALNANQLSAAQSYINTIGIAGIFYNVISKNADNLYIGASVYYQGQYSNVIQANVIAAITAFLQNITKTNFDGALLMSDLEMTIKNVAGVMDVLLNNVSCREDETPFGQGTQLIINSQIIQRSYQPAAGYMIPETTTGQTLADSLQFIAQ